MPIRPLLLIVALLSLGISLTACQSQTPHRAPCPAGERCLEYGNGPDPQSLDPQIATTTNEAAILRELFEGLYRDAADGSPEPGLADRVQTSPDGLVWTFHLRPEVWSDGVPVTAGDFVYAYHRMLNPKTASSYAYLLYLLKNAQGVNAGSAPPDSLGVKALDDADLQLTLEHPASYLPELLKHQAWFPIPAHVVETWGDRWSEPGHLVGNGAYVLTVWRLGDYARIVKNPRFREAASICFDQVTFYPTNDLVAAERRVLRGELDLNNSIQSNRFARLKANPASAPYARTHPYLSTGYIAFNLRDVPALRDLRVREAISMAIDRRFITDKLLRAGQVPTTSFVPHGIAGYLPPNGPHPQPFWADWPLEQRQAEARRLMAAAGYSPDHPLRLQLKLADSAGSINNAQSIQADLKSIGVKIDLRLEDGNVVYESLNLRDFQLGIAGWVADFNDPLTFLTLFKSDTGQQNYGDYNNPTYDALLNAADHEPDAKARARILARAEQMVLDSANMAPLDTGVDLNLVNPHITGWVDNDVDIHPIRYLCRNDAASAGLKPAA